MLKYSKFNNYWEKLRNYSFCLFLRFYFIMKLTNDVKYDINSSTLLKFLLVINIWSIYAYRSSTIRAKFSVKRSIIYVNFVKSIGIWCANCTILYIRLVLKLRNGHYSGTEFRLLLAAKTAHFIRHYLDLKEKVLDALNKWNRKFQLLEFCWDDYSISFAKPLIFLNMTALKYHF